jgi:hypothetical protein
LIWLEIVAASSALFKNQVATESHGPIPSPLATVKGRSFFGCCQRVETVARAFLATPGISPQKEKKKKFKIKKSKCEKSQRGSLLIWRGVIKKK